MTEIAGMASVFYCAILALCPYAMCVTEISDRRTCMQHVQRHVLQKFKKIKAASTRQSVNSGYPKPRIFGVA